MTEPWELTPEEHETVLGNKYYAQYIAMEGAYRTCERATQRKLVEWLIAEKVIVIGGVAIVGPEESLIRFEFGNASKWLEVCEKLGVKP